MQNYCLSFLIEEKECHLPADIRRGGGGGGGGAIMKSD